MRGRDSQGVWDEHDTMMYLEWIANMDLLCSAGNSAEYYAAAWRKGGSGGELIHVYM